MPGLKEEVVGVITSTITEATVETLASVFAFKLSQQRSTSYLPGRREDWEGKPLCR